MKEEDIAKEMVEHDVVVKMSPKKKYKINTDSPYKKLWKKLKRIIKEKREIAQEDIEKPTTKGKCKYYMIGCRDECDGLLLTMERLEEEIKEKERDEK